MAFPRFGRRRAARIPEGERVYVVGDVHGEAALLARLLDRIETDTRGRPPARTTLIFLGDVIDRGPHGIPLLQTLHAAAGEGAVVVLKGNHEDLFVRAYSGDMNALALWLKIGGRETLAGCGMAIAPFANDDDEIILNQMHRFLPVELLDWLEALPTSCTIGDYFFAHAGIRPGRALHRQRDQDLMWIRDLFLDSDRDHGKIVVHGHSVERAVPLLGGNRIGIDTGAHDHGRLTALCLEGERQWLLQQTDDAAGYLAHERPATGRAVA